MIADLISTELALFVDRCWFSRFSVYLATALIHRNDMFWSCLANHKWHLTFRVAGYSLFAGTFAGCLSMYLQSALAAGRTSNNQYLNEYWPLKQNVFIVLTTCWHRSSDLVLSIALEIYTCKHSRFLSFKDGGVTNQLHIYTVGIRQNRPTKHTLALTILWWRVTYSNVVASSFVQSLFQEQTVLGACDQYRYVIIWCLSFLQTFQLILTCSRTILCLSLHTSHSG